MKKLFILIAVCGLAATSCKKERTCECSMDGKVISSVKLPKAKKSDHETACSATAIGGIKCELK